ncbi:hypothetical protein PS838_04693 [Pseudomonas fluorescens]|nr:hypothetical protein PS838_04693 [Pseudomonas fluorescens]
MLGREDGANYPLGADLYPFCAKGVWWLLDRSHALRGDAARDALRPQSGRGASVDHSHAGAWE